MDNTDLDLNNIIFLQYSISSFLALQKIKEQIPLCRRLQKRFIFGGILG